MNLTRSLEKSLSTIRSDGLVAFWRDVGRWLRQRYFYQNWLAGKFVELAGNTGWVEGLRFDLNNPYIAAELKARFLFHTYEEGAHELITRYVQPHLPVIEFGGCIGVISCLTNRVVDNPRDHVVIEAHPGLVGTLEKNRNLNHCEFQIIHAALAYGKDRVSFWLKFRLIF